MKRANLARLELYPKNRSLPEGLIEAFETRPFVIAVLIRLSRDAHLPQSFNLDGKQLTTITLNDSVVLLLNLLKLGLLLLITSEGLFHVHKTTLRDVLTIDDHAARALTQYRLTIGILEVMS